MKIVADENIPFLRGIFEDVADIQYLAAPDINKIAIQDTDALIIRTRTKCNKSLLSGSSVKYIATATIGYDHIDIEYCEANGIKWSNAPGCNANSVVNYINAVLKFTESFPTQKTIGIVGVGNVGFRIAKLAKFLGFKVLLNDPPRQIAEKSSSFVPISEIQNKSDIITFHVPLNDSTYHIVDDDFISNCKRNPLIINAARGEVCDSAALLKCYNKIVLDCWENEPKINVELLNKVIIGTPHIAGYSIDGKANGTRIAATNICQFFGIKKTIIINLPPKDNLTYNVKEESDKLKLQPDKFEDFRNHYPTRRDIITF
ncbi:MAG: 4-phosphoerythronate dehydrogenase [Bacteroidia bacterium]|nr:4-phosphoerythronate dehydrogenase [Bacteroidia bacterium]